jgi:hypothetical protein
MVAMGPPDNSRYQFSGPQALLESTGLLGAPRAVGGEDWEAAGLRRGRSPAVLRVMAAHRRPFLATPSSTGGSRY